MINPITYKQVLGEDGSVEALEIWQAGKYITITFAHWEELKRAIDRVAARAKESGVAIEGDFDSIYREAIFNSVLTPTKET